MLLSQEQYRLIKDGFEKMSKPSLAAINVNQFSVGAATLFNPLLSLPLETFSIALSFLNHSRSFGRE